jgi:hypothetical protein
VVVVGLVFWVLDRGRIISPASSRVEQMELSRLRSAAARSALHPHEAGD